MKHAPFPGICRWFPVILIVLCLSPESVRAEVGSGAWTNNDPLQCILVLQGDLIEVDYYGKIEQVRLLGVRVPHLTSTEDGQPYADEARRFARTLMEGREVYLDYDRQLLDQDRRLLAYVYLPDGTLANEELLKRGYGRVSADHPFRMRDQFNALERSARQSRRGMWSKGIPAGPEK